MSAAQRTPVSNILCSLEPIDGRLAIDENLTSEGDKVKGNLVVSWRMD